MSQVKRKRKAEQVEEQQEKKHRDQTEWDVFDKLE